MKNRNWRLELLMASLVLGVVHSATALEIETVPVGNPGADGPNFVGAERPGIVNESFRIGKYEVTNQQYVEFLNAVDPTGGNALDLYNPGMATSSRSGIVRFLGRAEGTRYLVRRGRADYPVVLVSWYDAARFTNWLHNGQGTGGTETGAYDVASHPLDREPDARWFLPTRDEWVKAAYHSNNLDGSFYFAYPTSSDIPPVATGPTATPNRANFLSVNGGPTPVGSYAGSPSPYGTFDQGGNVREWTGGLTPSGLAQIPGGSWFSSEAIFMALNSNAFGLATNEFTDYGFRVATVVPEPSTSILLTLAFTTYVLSGELRRRLRC